MTSMGMQTREKKKNFLVAEEISALREIMPLNADNLYFINMADMKNL